MGQRLQFFPKSQHEGLNGLYVNYHSMRLAICIPTYDRHIAFLERVLDSIEAQTRLPDVVAISASSMTNELILKPRSFPIRLITTEEKQSGGGNRNRAAELIIKEQEADILVFFDSDDEMVPEYCEFVERAFNETGADFVLHSFLELKVCPEKSPTVECAYSVIEEPFLIDWRLYAGLYLKPSLSQVPIHHGHLSVKTSIFAKEIYFLDMFVPGHTYQWEDTEYNRRILNMGYKGVFIPAFL